VLSERRMGTRIGRIPTDISANIPIHEVNKKAAIFRSCTGILRLDIKAIILAGQFSFNQTVGQRHKKKDPEP
jgi:hypothetical protein